MTEKDVDSVSHFSPAVAVATPPPPWPVAYATATPPPLWPWRSHRHFGKAKVAVAWPWRTPPATVALLLLLSKGVLQELKSSLGCYSPSAREN